jgi:hypothetical protein
MESLRDCPFCRRPIVAAAVECKHCRQRVAPVANDPAGEVVLVEAGANHWRGIDSVGGKLKITTRRILFEPHGFNLQTAPLYLALADVAAAGRRNTLGIIPNGMYVRLKSGEEHRFVVWGRDRLIALIEERRQTPVGGGIS